VSVDSYMKNDASDVATYESLTLIDRNFEQILRELERLQQVHRFRCRPPIKSVELAVRETRAWAMFEILEVLHQREESEWTRLGRVRSRMEVGAARQPRPSRPK
jgi:hypothetical protein